MKQYLIYTISFVSLELPQYIAIVPYQAQQDDELSFSADVVLEILDPTNTSRWFKDRLSDQVGLIPSTYVQPIDTHNQCKLNFTFFRIRFFSIFQNNNDHHI